MKTLALILNFFLRYLPSFSRIGFAFRSAGWGKVTLDARGQTWLVTGASGGLGAAIVRDAANAGADVIAVARSRDKLEAMRARAGATRADITLIQADCASLAELRRLAERLSGQRIDVLVNNVGVLRDRFEKTAEGFEVSYATNLLGQFVLTEALIASGALGDGSAVISMSSGGMYNVPLLPDELDAAAEGFSGSRAYALHKRAQVVLTELWNDRYADRGIVFFVMHPGWVDTPGVQTSMPAFRKLLWPVLRDAREGIDTLTWLAAIRPLSGPDRIWFDRGARAAHVSEATRAASADAESLYETLTSDAAR